MIVMIEKSLTLNEDIIPVLCRVQFCVACPTTSCEFFN